MNHGLFSSKPGVSKCGPRSRYVNDEKNDVEEKLRNVFTKTLLIW